MQPIYYFDIKSESCHIELYINEFPAMKRNSKFYSNHAIPVNQYLVGNKNIVKVILIPTELTAQNAIDPDSALKKIKFSGSVKQYNPTDISCPEGGIIIQDFNFDQKPGGEFHFDNTIHDFSYLLIHGDKIKDTHLINDYALHLFAIAASNNADALVNEFRWKMRDYAMAAFHDELTMLGEFKSFLENDFFSFPPEKKMILPEEIYIRPYCDNRIFEVGLIPDEPLLCRPADAQGEEDYSIFVYVGLVDNKIKVVR